jgi:hypothetical protein
MQVIHSFIDLLWVRCFSDYDYHDNITYNPLSLQFSTIQHQHQHRQESTTNQSYPQISSPVFTKQRISYSHPIKRETSQSCVSVCILITTTHPSINKQTGKESKEKPKNNFSCAVVMHHKAHRSYRIRRNSAVIFQFSPSLLPLLSISAGEVLWFRNPRNHLP